MHTAVQSRDQSIRKDKPRGWRTRNLTGVHESHRLRAALGEGPLNWATLSAAARLWSVLPTLDRYPASSTNIMGLLGGPTAVLTKIAGSPPRLALGLIREVARLAAISLRPLRHCGTHKVCSWGTSLLMASGGPVFRRCAAIDY